MCVFFHIFMYERNGPNDEKRRFRYSYILTANEGLPLFMRPYLREQLM
jgi:hypothetical protein